MNKPLVLFVFLAMLTLVNGDPLQTMDYYFKPPDTIYLKRVTKLQPVTYSYALAAVDWTEYPGLVLTFIVPFSQFVDVKYLVSPFSNNACFLCTRLMVDKIENPLFRAISGNFIYHLNTFSDTIWFEKGNHTVTLQYRSDCSWPIIVPYDFTYAFLKVEYFD